MAPQAAFPQVYILSMTLGYPFTQLGSAVQAVIEFSLLKWRPRKLSNHVDPVCAEVRENQQTDQMMENN